MLLPPTIPVGDAPVPACAVVGMGRCVGSVRRAASDAGMGTMWFPEMDALLRRPPESMSLLVLAPMAGHPDLVPPTTGPMAGVPHITVFTDGGLAPSKSPAGAAAPDTFRFPFERDAFVAAAVEVVAAGSSRP